MVSGIPPEATITDVKWLDPGNIVAAGYMGDLFDSPGAIGIWRSNDGIGVSNVVSNTSESVR